MDKLCVFFVIALFTTGALGQADQPQDNDGGLDDRYGFNGPNWFPGQFPRPTRFPQFPNQNQNQFPNQNQGQRTTTTTPNPTGTTTMSPQQRQCISTCPVTAEYNPVCGTDMVTYGNPGRLNCAQSCGVSVSLLRTSPCPTTPAPIVQ